MPANPGRDPPSSGRWRWITRLLRLRDDRVDLLEHPAIELAAPLLGAAPAADPSPAAAPLIRAGEQLGSYRILREVGHGASASVYLAEDPRHERQVALKVLYPEVAASIGRQRFLQEIKLAARLQHPHILPVFDSGESAAGAWLWYAMPYVAGETLRQRLQREPRLPVSEAVQVAREVALALDYAHREGVVHRDIKPANILLADGQALVADFGIARALHRESTRGGGAPEGLTEAGIALGTPTYMSPEQVLGGGPVDGRSDQYSLGCVLYEMLVGRPPFIGPTPQSVVAQSLAAPRPRPSRHRADVPPALERLVLRAMAIDPAQRFPDMATVADALRSDRGESDARGFRGRRAIGAAVLAAALAIGGTWLATRHSTRALAPGAESIAIVPFTTSGPGVDLLGEGMVDLLSTNLQGVGGIRTLDPRVVLRRWSSHKTGGLNEVLALGRELGAGSVVTGTAVSAGSRVRLSAEMYSVPGDRLARAQVDGPLDSVLPLVDRLSAALLRDVWRSREPIPSLQLASVTTDSIEALRAYLQGEQYYRRAVFDSALVSYTRAVEVDSTFALAHVRRALAIGWLEGYGSPASLEASATGFRFALRLPVRDRRLLDGYHAFELGKPRAIDSLRAFLREYPDDLTGWYLLGESLYHLNSFAPHRVDTILAPFDRVLKSDSSLAPAYIHPIELALLGGDSVRFSRYWSAYRPRAELRIRRGIETAAEVAWKSRPGDSLLRAEVASPNLMLLLLAFESTYGREGATSDSVLTHLNWLVRPAQSVQGLRGLAVAAEVEALVGLGRLDEASRRVDSIGPLSPDATTNVMLWPLALGTVRAGYLGGRLDSLLRTVPPGPRREYAEAIRELARGRVSLARRWITAGLAMPDTPVGFAHTRGLLAAAAGWASLIEGDTLAGIRQLRAGIDEAAAPKADDDTAFLRFQLALALSSRAETRSEGILWLELAFHHRQFFVVPLTYLALGRAWEAAGEPDSAAHAYGRFVRLWDKADPPLQGLVREARDALARLTAETSPASSPRPPSER
jgi:eukaryotic-like serine/threonine-protein kinase